MNIISPDYIINYLSKICKDKNKTYKVSNREFILESVFLDYDPKKHMSVNVDSGLWQCFKTGEKGNFVQLYALLEGITRKEAYNKFIIEDFLMTEEERNKARQNTKPSVAHKRMDEEFENFTPVSDIPDGKSRLELEAWNLLYDRKLLSKNYQFYYCDKGFYSGRLIIPYYRNKTDGSELPFFFQARALGEMYPKYLNYKAFKSSNILLPFDITQDTVYVCEGIFDALTLKLNGLNATTCLSCSISSNQIEQLKVSGVRNIVVCFDNDEAGRKGLDKFEYLRRKHIMGEIKFCFPRKGYKDFNDAFVDNKDILSWIESDTQDYGPIYPRSILDTLAQK